MARYIALIFSVIFCVISVNSLVSGVKNKDPSLEIIKLEDAEEGYDYRPKENLLCKDPKTLNNSVATVSGDTPHLYSKVNVTCDAGKHFHGKSANLTTVSVTCLPLPHPCMCMAAWQTINDYLLVYDFNCTDETKETAKPDNTDDLPIYPLEHKDDPQCSNPNPVRGTMVIEKGTPFSDGCNVILRCYPGLKFPDGKSEWNLTCVPVPVIPQQCVWIPQFVGTPTCSEEVSDEEALGTKAVDTENEPSAVEEPYTVEQPSEQETYPDAYNLEENNGYDTAMKNTEPEEDLTGTFYENNGEINEVNDVHLNLHGRESGTNEEVNANGGQENFEESTNQIDFPGNNYIESDDNREKQMTEQNSVDTENQDTNQQLVKEKAQIEVPENEIQEPSENGQSEQKQQNPLEPEEETEQEPPVETEPANVEGSENTKIEHEEEPEEETGDISEHEANTGSEFIEHVEAEEYQEIGENNHADNLEVQKNEVHPDMEYVTENSNYRESEKEEHENVELENEERGNKENEIEEKEDDNKENEQNERFAKNEYETEASELKKSDIEEPFVDEENEDNKEGEEKQQETNMVFSEVNPLRPPNIKQSSRIYSAIQDSLAEEEKEKEETEIDHKDPDIEPPGYLRDIQSFPFRASKEEIKTDEDEVCSLTAKTGFCKAYFRRYYFNSMTGECENFVYGGCGGNGNNFETLTDCRKTCMKHVLL